MSDISSAQATELAPLRVRAVKLAEQQFLTAKRKYDLGMGNLEAVVRWSKKWAKVRGQRAALIAHLKRMREFEEVVRLRVKSGQASADEAQAIEFYTVEAQLLLGARKKSR